MRKILFIVAMAVVALGVKAQVMQAKAVWTTYNVPQMKCWECKNRLEKYLFHETGSGDEASVFKVIVNMFNGTVRINYAPDRITADYLRAAIANAGYDVDSLKANTDSYKLLPPVCKRKEDGGGPQKGKACNIAPEGEEQK